MRDRSSSFGCGPHTESSTSHTGLWKDPAAWGIALVDLAKHIAIAYAQTTDVSEHETLARIRAGFDAEWGNPTDVPSASVR